MLLEQRGWALALLQDAEDVVRTGDFRCSESLSLFHMSHLLMIGQVGPLFVFRVCFLVGAFCGFCFVLLLRLAPDLSFDTRV